jgi:hypothetical protein
MKHLLVPSLALLLTSCHSHHDSPQPVSPAPLVLSAGMETITASPAAEWTTRVDRARLGLDNGEPIACYELTTPVGEPFQFDVLSRATGNAGNVILGLAHAADGDTTPASGIDSIARAGIVPSASGTLRGEPWIQAWGDGFSHISVQGAVQQEQILALRADNGDEKARALVHIAIGPRSVINVGTTPVPDYPGVTDRRTIYTSNSWLFGLPTATVSGDRTTVVTYEGDRGDPRRWQRYEMRLQVDHQTHAVTGGASYETSGDTGNWRDHELAGLFNVLALVHCGAQTVDLRLSFDRGASFAQTIELDHIPSWSPRLCQIAMAADYSLAVTWWSSHGAMSELMLARGAPVAFDPQGSPTWYAMQPAETIHTAAADVTPLLMGMTWSEGGDLVIGYAFTDFSFNQGGMSVLSTESRCAVFPWHGTPRDVVVDMEEAFMGRDPSVAVLGSGDTMRVLYAYEGLGGVRLRASSDGGRTFGPKLQLDGGATGVPTVLAREQGGVVRVDLLYLSQEAAGQELHVRHWDDFDNGVFGDYRLTHAVLTPCASVPRNQPVPGAPNENCPDFGMRVTQVHWSGYDAVLDGDDVVVVVDEITYDTPIFLSGMHQIVNSNSSTSGWIPPGGFGAAQPPPLAPGLTQPAPQPNVNHLHQLRMLRLD